MHPYKPITRQTAPLLANRHSQTTHTDPTPFDVTTHSHTLDPSTGKLLNTLGYKCNTPNSKTLKTK